MRSLPVTPTTLRNEDLGDDFNANLRTWMAFVDEGDGS